MINAIRRKRVDDIFREIRSRMNVAPKGKLPYHEPEVIVQILAERIVELEERVGQLERRSPQVTRTGDSKWPRT